MLEPGEPVEAQTRAEHPLGRRRSRRDDGKAGGGHRCGNEEGPRTEPAAVGENEEQHARGEPHRRAPRERQREDDEQAG